MEKRVPPPKEEANVFRYDKICPLFYDLGFRV